MKAMTNIIVCEDRNSFIDEIKMQILVKSSNVYCFVGKSGVGKKYVLERLEGELEKNFKIYRIVSDSILVKNKRRLFHQHSLEVSFSLGGLVGLALTSQKDNSSKINYIISNLSSSVNKKRILISAIDYERLSSESREFLSILIANHEQIEQKLKKQITILVTGINNYYDTFNNIIQVKFADYTQKDLFFYLRDTLRCSPNYLTHEKLKDLYRLCGTNWDLVNCYFRQLIYDGDADCSIEAIVDRKYNYYICSGHIYNLTKEDLENILFISSNSISTVTPHMISKINHKLLETASSGLKCAADGYFLEKVDQFNKNEYENYFFISEQEKAYICKRVITNHENINLQYYIYLSTHMEDEYFERALYLSLYLKRITKEVFALIVLELSKSYMLNDKVKLNKVSNFILENAEFDFINMFNQINKAYEGHFCHQYQKSNNLINAIDFSILNPVTAAELRRLQFKNEQLNNSSNSKVIKILTNQLKTYVEKRIFLFTEILFEPNDEKLLTLRIIFDLAPYMLDSQNDIESFNSLYDKSLVIKKYIHNTAAKKSYADYIINVFNRKAFLFAAPAIALVYYEEAESYFRDNGILDELSITLASKAGINISLERYDAAITDCTTALKIMDNHKLVLNQAEKILNNLYIAEFLKKEQCESSIDVINSCALETIMSLKKITGHIPCGKKHVVLTNIASLYLYVNNENKYTETKCCLEQSLNCKDVADVYDSRINDFYRYHFAWFEFYRFFKNENWGKCSNIVDNLNGFYPSIFHDRRKMDLRIEAARELISQKSSLSPKDFSLHFLDYTPAGYEYSSRGLLLSDLQFTSYD